MLSNLFCLFCSFLILFTHASAAPGRKHHGAEVSGIGVPVSNFEAGNIIPNRYIVVYNNNASDEAVSVHQASVMTKVKRRNLKARGRNGQKLSNKMQAFAMSGWRCMTVDAEDSMILEIESASEVSYVEADTIVKSSALLSQSNATPGLGSISHKEAGNTSYVFNSNAGKGITAYVVDTGILTTHSEFQGRATWGANLVNTVDTDENGHGSHVAGTIAGVTFGVAKSANLVAVKVLDANGDGTASDVIAGIQFVATNAASRNLSGKAVMNMSLGSSKSTALNAAIAALSRLGVVAIVAAGNDGTDALNDSPASAPSAITVGAIDSEDAMASFSNFGTAVDIFAPGVDVLSVGTTSNTATETLSGTSMASPHVAGLAAYLMSLERLNTTASVTARIKQLAGTTSRKVSGAGTGTTTLIAYNGNGY